MLSNHQHGFQFGIQQTPPRGSRIRLNCFWAQPCSEGVGAEKRSLTILALWYFLLLFLCVSELIWTILSSSRHRYSHVRKSINLPIGADYLEYCPPNYVHLRCCITLLAAAKTGAVGQDWWLAHVAGLGEFGRLANQRELVSATIRIFC